MNELQVTVQQKPGIINWNFEEIKAVCQREMDTYKKLVATEDTIQGAKAKLTELRKYRTQVEDVRKSVKRECLKPYDEFEAQAKELVAVIDEPIELINKQVADYESNRKKQRRTEILSYMDKSFSSLPKEVAEILKQRLYNIKWENVTAKKGDWTSAIDNAAQEANHDLQIINGVEEEFRGYAQGVYYKTLTLAYAIDKVEELRKQKNLILENERRRAEAESARKAQQAAEQVRKISLTTANPITVEKAECAVPDVDTADITVKAAFTGEREKIKKIFAYAKFIGVGYEVMEVM